MNEEDIKIRRKESIKREHFLFRLLIIFGAVNYKVTYDRFHGFRKTYKVRIWHPLVLLISISVIIINIPIIIFKSFKDFKDECKEHTYYC